MIFEKTLIPKVFLIKPLIHKDIRGSFFRTYCKSEYKHIGINFAPLQTSQSYNKRKGTIRGLHFQTHPKEEQKIVLCVKGAIYDVIVDLRKNSPTYLKWLATTLSEKNHYSLFIPKGCAHGYQTLTDDCIVDYYISNNYSMSHQSGILWNDKRLSIPWPIKKNIIISDKDRELMPL